MKAEKSNQTYHKKRFLKWLLAAVVVLIAVILFGVPAFISSSKGKKLILDKINNSVAGQVDFADLSMSWWKGITVNDLIFQDKPGQTSVRIKRFYVKPHYIALLFGTLSFGQTQVEKPSVEIALRERAVAESGMAKPKATTLQTSKAPAVPIKKMDLKVSDGRLKVADSHGRTVEVKGINSQVKLRPPGQRSEFALDMAAADAKVRTSGWVEPDKKGWSFKGTSGRLTVEVNDLNLASLAPIFELSGIEVEAKGRLSADINCKIKQGKIEALAGNITGRDVEVGGELLKGGKFKTATLDARMKLNRQDEQINIDELAIDSQGLKGWAKGVLPATFESLEQFLDPNSGYKLEAGFECNIAELLSQMPALFRLKEGVNITSGRLTGGLKTIEEADKKVLFADANLSGLSGLVGEKEVALSQPVTLRMYVSSAAGTVTFDELKLSSSFAKINIRGTGARLNYEGQLDLAAFQSQLGRFLAMGGYEMAGQYSSKGRVNISQDKLVINGSSVLQDFKLSLAERATVEEPKTDVDFSLTLLRSSDILDVNFVNLVAGFGQVEIKNSIIPLKADSPENLELNVEAKQVDLSKLQPFAVLFGYMPKEIHLSGIGESKIQLSRVKGAYRIISESTKVEKLRLEYPGKEPFVQQEILASFDVIVDPKEKTTVVKKLKLVSPQIKIDGSFENTVENRKRKLQGKVEFEYDWKALTSLMAQYLPAGLELEGQRKESLEFAGEYQQDSNEAVLSGLNARTALGFSKGRFKGLEFGPTEVPLEIKQGLLKIGPFSTTVNNGKLNFAGEVDLSVRPLVLKTREPMRIADDIEITDELGRQLLVYLNPIFADFSSITGVVDFECQQLSIPLGKASPDKILVEATIAMDRLWLQGSPLLGTIFGLFGGSGVPGQDFRLHPTQFSLQEGQLRYDDMQIDIGNNPLNFSAVIGLDHSIKQMEVTLPYTYTGRTVRVGQASRADRITLPIKGTLEKPELDTSKLLEQQLRKQLEQRLKEKLFQGLDGLFK